MTLKHAAFAQVLGMAPDLGVPQTVQCMRGNRHLDFEEVSVIKSYAEMNVLLHACLYQSRIMISRRLSC